MEPCDVTRARGEGEHTYKEELVMLSDVMRNKNPFSSAVIASLPDVVWTLLMTTRLR